MTLLIARRPVFDSQETIFAYDLAVHDAADPSATTRDVQPEQLLAEVFLERGIKTVAGDHPVFVRATRDLLLTGTVRALPSDRVILQVPRTVPSDPDLTDVCRDLASSGYRLSMDADERTLESAPFISAHVIRVDVAGVAPDALPALAERLRGYPARLLATNVQHRGERDQCAALGFDLFEGYQFSAPEVLSRRDLGVEHLQAFRVLKLLRDPAADDRDIEVLIQGEVGLSYKLLRMASSAAIGGRDIWSIGHALRVVGREQVARWLGVILVSDAGTTGVRGELTQLALVRAHMCDGVAKITGVPRARGSLFLVGMVSVLDQLLEMPMAALCDVMELAPDLRDALLHRTDFFGSALRLVEAYVAGRWDDVEAIAPALDIAATALQPLYLEALQWAASQTRSEPLH